MTRFFERTRLAPTPSGFLHLGNIYSFSLTVELARRYRARMLLRIDDLDNDRKDARYVHDIFDTLRYLGIRWDEGPTDAASFERDFSQMRRLSLYQAALELLREKGLVYACRCSRREILAENASGIYPGTCRNKGIPLDEEGVNWRLDTSRHAVPGVRTPEGTVHAALPPQMRDFVVRKKDGMPAYQLTSVVDDLHFGCDLVVRGQDLWDSTLAQLYLARCLGEDRFANVTFLHHALLRSPGGMKLSKSAGHESVQHLIRSGKSVEAIFEMARPTNL